jgi:nucleoside diphosphate kinase
MAQELAFILINPYTIAKSRTGGVIARIISRSDLHLVGARMFGPSVELASRYAELVKESDPRHAKIYRLISDYIAREYSPDPETGRPSRVMLLLFEGESAVRKIWGVTGSATGRKVSGSTLRDTYGDYILDDCANVKYFEPAVFVARNAERAAATLRLWSEFSESDGGLIDHAGDVPEGTSVEKTLVMLKPDNFRFPSLRPGSIIDVLSSSGLRIVAVRKFSMSVAQAEDFYGPVKYVLEKKFADIGAGRAAGVLSNEFGFTVPESATHPMCEKLGALFAHHQFESIVAFMTGHKPSNCPDSMKSETGSEECLALVYEGVNAVKKIRNILGPTDPTKAAPGSVRREFGTDIMINAAHASDSPENALREMRIVNIGSESISDVISKYYGQND